MTSAVTIPALFRRTVTRYGQRDALWVAVDGSYRPRTWNTLAGEVRRLAAGLRRAGVQPGDRVVQVAENRPEWIVADLAVLAARAVHVPVHATLAGPQVAYQINHSGARLVLLSGRQQADALADHIDRLPGLRWYVYDDWPDRADHSIPIRPFATLLDAIPDAFGLDIEEEAVRETAPEDLATILYTSGTTGEPKGVMLSHGNLVSNAVTTCQAYGGSPDNRRLGILPLSHIYARTCDLYTWIAMGSQFALSEDWDSVLKNCAQIRPTDMNGVPYFYDKVCRLLALREDASQPGALNRLLGGGIQFCCSGGAALPDSVAQTFRRHGVPLLQGYGLSETSPVISFSSPDADKVGSVGRPLPGIEVRIAADGEILTRGPHVMLGYWQDAQATAETIRGGWLHTGDLGAIDEEGYLTIRGRKKEILVTATGKNVVPIYLEGLLTASPLIAQAMVIGDARNFLTALIVPDADALQPILRQRQLAGLSWKQAIGQPEIVELFRGEIDSRLANVSHAEQIGGFEILTHPFSQELGEMTTKLSLRRHVIEKHYHDVIERMYGSPS